LYNLISKLVLPYLHIGICFTRWKLSLKP